MTQMTTPQILRAAATHIETYGWEKGRLHGAPKTIQRLVPPTLGPVEWAGAAGMTPVETVAETTYAYSSACTLGALEIVSGARVSAKYNSVTDSSTVEFRAYAAAVRALEIHLYETLHISSIPGWNDSVAQTAEEVITTLRTAADVIEARTAEAMGKVTTGLAAMNAAVAKMLDVTPGALAAIKAMAQTWEASQDDEIAIMTTPEADAVAALNEAAAVIEAAQSETVSA